MKKNNFGHIHPSCCRHHASSINTGFPDYDLKGTQGRHRASRAACDSWSVPRHPPRTSRHGQRTRPGRRPPEEHGRPPRQHLRAAGRRVLGTCHRPAQRVRPATPRGRHTLLVRGQSLPGQAPHPATRRTVNGTCPRRVLIVRSPDRAIEPRSAGWASSSATGAFVSVELSVTRHRRVCESFWLNRSRRAWMRMVRFSQPFDVAGLVQVVHDAVRGARGDADPGGRCPGSAHAGHQR